eukprot:m.23039 g.23039  ORF g.23039 m.23039 type:complete len:55 (-) comp8443_c0_seq1:7-171(-)
MLWHGRHTHKHVSMVLIQSTRIHHELTSLLDTTATTDKQPPNSLDKTKNKQNKI